MNKFSNVYIVSAYEDSEGSDEPERRFYFAYSNKEEARSVMEKGRKVAWHLFWEMENVLIDHKEFTEHLIERIAEDVA